MGGVDCGIVVGIVNDDEQCRKDKESNNESQCVIAETLHFFFLFDKLDWCYEIQSFSMSDVLCTVRYGFILSYCLSITSTLSRSFPINLLC